MKTAQFVVHLLSKSTKKSILGTDPLSFNTLSRFPIATTRYPATCREIMSNTIYSLRGLQRLLLSMWKQCTV